MDTVKYYLKGILAFVAAECTGLGAVAATGHLNLAGILTATGGALVTSGLVAAVGNGPKPAA